MQHKSIKKRLADHQKYYFPKLNIKFTDPHNTMILTQAVSNLPGEMILPIPTQNQSSSVKHTYCSRNGFTLQWSIRLRVAFTSQETHWYPLYRKVMIL